MLLSACSHSDNAANESDNAPQNNVTPPADSPNTNTGTNQGNAGNAGDASNSAGDASGGASGNGANQPSGNTGGGTSGNTSEPSGADGQTSAAIKAMLELAKDGKVKGIPFAADKGLIDDVEKDWGKSDKTDFAGKGLYATYAKKHAVIGFNKGSQIFDVRSDAPELRTLTLKQIEAALGKADQVTKNGTDTIYAYEANKTFELRFIIPADTGKVDHISVYAPADTINNMAG
ncbi:YjgB family protein [Paenibacillus sp. MWE-103]|uniref:YjgB family protein n=2 Tax=Paenibacillus artemisiicola TaxID=1172618 RepID=A0ABS3WJF8_9BACL|nr:YjgB family protein [Paenibacillus artemisiicola]